MKNLVRKINDKIYVEKSKCEVVSLKYVRNYNFYRYLTIIIARFFLNYPIGKILIFFNRK